MKPFHKLALLTGVLLGALAGESASAATLIIKDNFTATNNLTGFLLNEGINSEINPPLNTRLEGIAAEGLRYINRAARPTYYIPNNKVRINQGNQSGRFTFGSDDTTPFSFGTHLGIASATPENPVQYDVTISMDNNASAARMSFGLATVESAVTGWDFGIQIAKSGTTYKIYKRIDSGSWDTVSTDLNAEIHTTAENTAGDELDFLLRVTDAGAETTTFSSRVQVALTTGSTTNWIYDTATDADLATGWRFDGADRFVIGDVAANDGFVTYDNLAIVLNPTAEVSPAVLTIPTGAPGNWTFNFVGTPGATYTVQRAASLTGNWNNLGTVTTDSNTGAGSYTDSADRGSNNSFYRVRGY